MRELLPGGIAPRVAADKVGLLQRRRTAIGSACLVSGPARVWVRNLSLVISCCSNQRRMAISSAPVSLGHVRDRPCVVAGQRFGDVGVVLHVRSSMALNSSPRSRATAFQSLRHTTCSWNGWT